MYRIAFMIIRQGRLLSSVYFSSDGRKYGSLEPAIRDAEKQNAAVSSIEYVVVCGTDIIWQKPGSRVPPNMQAREVPRAERSPA